MVDILIHDFVYSQEWAGFGGGVGCFCQIRVKSPYFPARLSDNYETGIWVEVAWMYAGYGGRPTSQLYKGLALCHLPMASRTYIPPLNSLSLCLYQYWHIGGSVPLLIKYERTEIIWRPNRDYSRPLDVVLLDSFGLRY